MNSPVSRSHRLPDADPPEEEDRCSRMLSPASHHPTKEWEWPDGTAAPMRTGFRGNERRRLTEIRAVRLSVSVRQDNPAF